MSSPRTIAPSRARPNVNRLATLAVAGLATTAALVGCSSTSTTSTATTTTAAPATSAPGTVPKSFAIETPSGQVSLSLDGNLPPNWPKSFPTPTGATPAGSGSLGGSDGSTMVGVFKAPGSAEDAFSFYKSNSAVTLESPKSAGVGSAYIGRASLTGTYSGSLTVGGVGGQDLIVVVLKGVTAGTGSTVPGTTPGSTPGSTPGTTAGTTPGTTAKSGAGATSS